MIYIYIYVLLYKAHKAYKPYKGLKGHIRPYKPYQGSIIGLISPYKALFLGLSWAIWAILNHFGVILGPFLGHLEGVFEVSVFRRPHV